MPLPSDRPGQFVIRPREEVDDRTVCAWILHRPNRARTWPHQDADWEFFLQERIAGLEEILVERRASRFVLVGFFSTYRGLREMSKRDVFRDENGEPVTITPQQFQAIWHAIRTVEDVRRWTGYEPIGGSTGRGWHPDLAMSRLLGRMLMDGRPPLDEMPPPYVAARGYHLVEPDLTHWYLGSTPVLFSVGIPIAVEPLATED